MTRVNITLPDHFLEQIDRVAEKDYATRSEIIRQAVLFYLRFTASTLNKADFETMFKMMKNRQLQAYIRKSLKS